MKRFVVDIGKFFTILFIPFSLLMAMYLYFDPFMVIHEYDTYYKPEASAMIALNRGHVSMKVLKKNSQDISYNSFILGNSRSIFFQVKDWKKHLDENAECYHLDGTNESLLALTKRLIYLEEQGYDLTNLLLVLDFSVLSRIEFPTTHLEVISPSILGQSGIFNFQKSFFRAYATPKFLYSFLDFKTSGKVKKYMLEEYIFDNVRLNYEWRSNEIRFDYYEDLIEQGIYSEEGRLPRFYTRDSVERYSVQSIGEGQKALLERIGTIVKNHCSNFKLVISPLYDQQRLDRGDFTYLRKVFGSENVYDFSGKNELTEDTLNYYESSHYRPHVAREIMDSIYAR
ncbi:MAG: hypothetical protein H6608_11760 [Flavobacteriales bacterium]|nr:hypothetical protein [Bacteroidota bacterium]MCB9241804.1 hypothetical protein [Flavobacteriales bacterium]